MPSPANPTSAAVFSTRWPTKRCAKNGAWPPSTRWSNPPTGCASGTARTTASARSTCLELGLLLMLSDGLPCGDSERADGQREDFATRHSSLRDCFFEWATAGKPSHLDRYQEAGWRTREADDMEDEA